MSVISRDNLVYLWREYKRQVLSILPSFNYVPHLADQFEGVARATPAAMLGHCLNTSIAVVAFYKVAGIWELALWAASSYLIAAYVFWRRLRAAQRALRSPNTSGWPLRRAERRAIVFAAMLALPWAYLAVRFLGGPNQPAETVLITLGVGMAASGAVLLAPLARAAVAYMSAILGPTAFTCFFILDASQYGLLGALAISYWLFLLALIGATNQLFRIKSQAVERLTDALEETRTARERIEHLALHDSLTELSNRRAFLHRLNNAIMRASATGCASWVVFLIDLDRFKIVNDTFGHKFGDELLKQVALRLRTCVRPGDLVARLGGDEFSVVAEDVHDAGRAEEIARRMLGQLERPFIIYEREVSIGASIGVAAPLSHTTDSEQLMRCADLALYEAKETGRNRFKMFELEMQDRMDARSSVEIGLRSAVANGELELFFQPIYDLASLKLARFEALIRWRHPQKGLLSPADFLPVAEEIGLINEVGDWVVREACRQAMDWPADVNIAVNLSPIQVNSASVVDLVEGALTASGLPARRLEIEITETALLSDTEQTRQKLEKLKGLGVTLSMDDFGTGYSSLSYLASFPLDGIKIDKGFIARFETRTENAEIMRAMLELARALNRSSTVEGIETLAQLSAAQALGATYGQGYYFSRPLPAAKARELMQNRTEMLKAMKDEEQAPRKTG